MLRTHLKSINKFPLIERLQLGIGLIYRKLISGGIEKLLRIESLVVQIIQLGGIVKDKGDCMIFSFTPTFAKSRLNFVLRKKSTDAVIFSQIIMNSGGDYSEVLNVVNSLKVDINTIIDAGANIGCATMFFSNVFDKAKIISIEADQRNFNILEQNIQLNNYKNVITLRNAFWKNNDELNFGIGLRGTREKELSFGVTNDETSYKVNGITFKDCLRILETDRIDLLKIDIEGAEKALIDDSENFRFLLEHTKIIAIELHKEVIDAVTFINLIEEQGFRHIQNGEIVLCWKR